MQQVAAKISELDSSLDFFQCVLCHQKLLSGTRGFECSNCRTVYPLKENTLDTLLNPHEEVIREMKGMAREMGLPLSDWAKIKMMEVDKTSTFDDLLNQTKDDPNDYYKQTAMSFKQAFDQIKGRKFDKVLEIGSESGFYFLKHFYDMGSNCFAANLRFFISKEQVAGFTPFRVLADMNDLPFVDSSFDLVLMSATTHHSPDLDKTISELNRVLKPGGVALVLNDQIDGWFKILKGDWGHGRDDLIHENFYSIGKYHRTFLKYHFRPQYLFSDFYDQKLLTRKIHPGQRFAKISKIVSLVWSFSIFRNFSKKYLLRTAQIVFGFPLNVILRKQHY